MEPSSIGAARHYQIAKQALLPDVGASSKASNVGGSKPSGLAKGVAEFSKVFETVETTTQAMVSGQGDAHSVVEALATAEVALEAAVTIRNRVVEAYQELLRMPV